MRVAQNCKLVGLKLWVRLKLWQTFKHNMFNSLSYEDRNHHIIHDLFFHYQNVYIKMILKIIVFILIAIFIGLSQVMPNLFRQQELEAGQLSVSV